MIKETIKISLTEFMNYVNKSGSQKTTVVVNAKTRREDEYKTFKDYWFKLRESIKSIHKKGQEQEDLMAIIEEVHEDKRDNYNIAIKGYCTFWGKKKINWITPPHKTWAIGDIRIELNPELGLKIKDKTYYIKLFTSSNDNIDRRHADLILALMEKELRDKVETNAIFGVLDIKRGKLFEYKNNDSKLFLLLEVEATSFESLWKRL